MSKLEGTGRADRRESMRDAVAWIVLLHGTTNSQYSTIAEKWVFYPVWRGSNTRDSVCLAAWAVQQQDTVAEREVGVIYHSDGSGRRGIQYKSLMHIAAMHMLSAVVRRVSQTCM